MINMVLNRKAENFTSGSMNLFLTWKTEQIHRARSEVLCFTIEHHIYLREHDISSLIYDIAYPIVIRGDGKKILLELFKLFFWVISELGVVIPIREKNFLF